MSVQPVGGAGYIYDLVNLVSNTQMQQAQAMVQVAASQQLSSDQLSNIQTAQAILDVRM